MGQFFEKSLRTVIYFIIIKRLSKLNKISSLAIFIYTVIFNLNEKVFWTYRKFRIKPSKV